MENAELGNAQELVERCRFPLYAVCRTIWYLLCTERCAMKLIPSRDLRIRPGKVWSDLKKEEELVITSHGQPVAIMVPVSGEDLEAKLRMLRAARFQETVRRIQQQSVRQGTDHLTEAEIEGEIRQARKARRR